MEVMEAVEIEKEAFATAAKEDEQWPRPRKNRKEHWEGPQLRESSRNGARTAYPTRGSEEGGDSEVPILAHAMGPGGKVIAQVTEALGRAADGTQYRKNRSNETDSNAEVSKTSWQAREGPIQSPRSRHRSSLRFVQLTSTNLGGMM